MTVTDPGFDELTAPLRAELLAHCYRMSGSAADAEDLLQETYLRAWKAFHRFEGRSSVRTWMYTIATNVCVTAATARRVLPVGLGGEPSNPLEPVVPSPEVPWLQPLPDAALGDPGEHVVAREGIGLAMVAALQVLPAKQRAALILRDVLGFSAAETAEALGTTVASANSALQRARASIGDGAPQDGRRVVELSEREREVWEEVCAAFERHDIDGVVRILAADATWEMPPIPGWYRGAEQIGMLSRTQCPAQVAGDLRMIPVVCNGMPAAAMYLRDGDIWLPFQLDVLTFTDGALTHVSAFLDPAALFALAGLPPTLTA
ncbi:sigma-70 family RNA polymerase sigma factor [Tsukamurella sp. 1534]|uniref:sigma-70 family RNA polymerase sigma factor n=1 Tax=Tsukamurella sp. 1534 TaxID=1151061 RepID=UPI0002FA79EF|nr:sigma-70 family RNA polymerase sigma factor [Tsukamurella sp. 1534]